MTLNIIIGAQWGDEGKGRYTDLLATTAAIVARYSGGDNAGHTVNVQGEVFKLHLIPSGIIHEGVVCVVGGGVVMNPAVILREMSALAERGVDVSPERLKISGNVHLITPAHIALDKAREMQKGEGAIGTTQRGIGPAYTDKVSRDGLRARLLARPEALTAAITAHVIAKNEVLTKLYGAEPLDPTAVAAEYAQYAQQLAPHLVNGAVLINEALENGRFVLAEGAQGTFLDIDHGTYPFVTSSSPIAGGAMTGLGVGPKYVQEVIGVAKAFTTRVGSGPFPCELEGALAHRLRGSGSNPWDEYGTTTGRPRRVGWLDIPMLKHAARINGLTQWAITKMDVLTGLTELKVCVGYEVNGRRLDHFPDNLETLADCQPIYETLPSWSEDVTAVRHFDDLPDNAQNYIHFIAQATGVPVRYISVGPARDQVVMLGG